MDKQSKSSLALDDWGMGASLLCSIHCALTPLLILSSVFVGWQAEQLEKLEAPLFLLAAIIGLISISHTYLNQKNAKPAIFLLTGLILILAGGFTNSFWAEPSLRISGSLLIVYAHYANKKIVRESA